jgi:hypothetical protein
MRSFAGRSRGNGRETEDTCETGCRSNVSASQSVTDVVELGCVIERQVWGPAVVPFDQLDIDFRRVWALAD